MNIQSLAKALNLDYFGDAKRPVLGIKALEEAQANYISFGHKLNEEALSVYDPNIIWVVSKPLDNIHHGLVCADIKQALYKIIGYFYPQETVQDYRGSYLDLAKSARIDKSVYLDSFVKIGENTSVGSGTKILSHVSIGKNCKIGKGCILNPQVVLYDGVHLGDDVIIHSGAVIGADGFGYLQDEGLWKKLPHIGSVIVEDGVEIGSNTVIDRAMLYKSKIGKGTKLDNLIHIGHNVSVGNHCAIAAQTGVAGSTIIEDAVIMGGQVGVADHVKVTKNTVFLSKSGITKSILSEGVYSGFPAQSAITERKEKAKWKKFLKSL